MPEPQRLPNRSRVQTSRSLWNTPPCCGWLTARERFLIPSPPCPHAAASAATGTIVTGLSSPVPIAFTASPRNAHAPGASPDPTHDVCVTPSRINSKSDDAGDFA